ncbi:class E sortase [Nocardioides ungokensis]|uniref:class E sortase n=1 Tax=Nocardioides ungokensis TaxID=1643322 RepID=UPI0015DFDAB6|nr:class E sortase [Nocardioides ungokensis]
MTATLTESPRRRARSKAALPTFRRRGGAPQHPRAVAPVRAATPPTPAENTSAVVSSAFTMFALLCLWTAAQMLFLGNLSHERAQELLYREFRTQLAGATAPLGPIVPVGDPVAVVSAPTVGLEQVVVEGTASGDTLAGPGHRRDTPLPGQEGTSVVYGRASTYGGPFHTLTGLRPGDPVTVAAAQGKLTFTVLDVRRAGDPLPQPVEPGRARLTLVTAEGSGRLASIAPKDVVYVDAEARKAFPAPPGRPRRFPNPRRRWPATRVRCRSSPWTWPFSWR